MKKKRIFWAFLLFAALILSAQAEAITVAEFDGGAISYADAVIQYQSLLSSYADLGIDEGLDADALAQEVLADMVADAILYRKAQELGLTEPSEEDLAASATATYESLISYYIEFCATEGMTEAEARSTTEAYLAEQGQSLQDILASLEDNAWRNAIYEFICGDVDATDEDIEAYYEALVATQQLQFAADPSYFDYLYMNDELIAYYPEHLRYIKHILIGFDEDEALAYQTLTGDGDLSDANSDALDELYAALDDRVSDVMERLMCGEDFDELMRTHGDDDNMLYEPYSLHGYILREGSMLFVDEFTSAAFALQSVGDISDPVRSPGGIHFLLYVDDVPTGPVPLAEIYDSVAIEAREQKIADAYDAQVEAWVAEANPIYHPEYLLQ